MTQALEAEQAVKEEAPAVDVPGDKSNGATQEQNLAVEMPSGDKSAVKVDPKPVSEYCELKNKKEGVMQQNIDSLDQASRYLGHCRDVLKVCTSLPSSLWVLPPSQHSAQKLA